MTGRSADVVIVDHATKADDALSAHHLFVKEDLHARIKPVDLRIRFRDFISCACALSSAELRGTIAASNRIGSFQSRSFRSTASLFFIEMQNREIAAFLDLVTEHGKKTQ
jgi:hypothetical protein